MINQLCAIGSHHAYERADCQDRLMVQQVGDYLIAALADGMGAYRLSGEGAQICTTMAYTIAAKVVSLDEHFQESAKSAVESAFWAARNELLASPEPEDMLCTLCVVVCDLKNRQLAYGYVGDGGLVVSHAGVVTLLEQPQKGSAFNETNCIADVEDWCFGYCEDFDALLLATDGVYDALTGANIELPDKALRLNELMELAEVGIDQETFERLFPENIDEWMHDSPLGFCTDDRSLLLLNTEKPAEEEPAEEDFAEEELPEEELIRVEAERTAAPAHAVRPKHGLSNRVFPLNANVTKESYTVHPRNGRAISVCWVRSVGVRR